MGMFYNRPFESVTIQWRLSQKSETFQCEVPIHLPDEFTKERGHSIVFTIFPEHKKVDVSYEILDLKTEHMSIVPQQIPEKTH